MPQGMDGGKMHPRNPYMSKDGEPLIRTSFCVYMDILGFKEEFKKAVSSGEHDALFHRLRGVLTKKPFGFVHDEPDEDFDEWLWQHKIFTDNIVFGYPVDEGGTDGESEFGAVITTLTYFQTAMAISGFFIRGGFSVGPLYVGEDMVYGEAVLSAYTVESEVARDPRIVLTEDVVDLVRQHMKYYSHPEESPQNADLLRDADGRVFVNYLHSTIEDPEYIFWDVLEKHRKQVVNRLASFRTDTRVWSKYVWVAGYHDMFCRSLEGCPGYKKSILIDPDFKLKFPARLV
jgi:hypothetical protein